MNDNVVVVRFAETSKAYEALSVLKRLGDAGDLDVRSAVLLERGRIEAFSDGVFNDCDQAARPRSQCVRGGLRDLWRVIADQWPSYLGLSSRCWAVGR